MVGVEDACVAIRSANQYGETDELTDGVGVNLADGDVDACSVLVLDIFIGLTDGEGDGVSNSGFLPA